MFAVFADLADAMPPSGRVYAEHRGRDEYNVEFWLTNAALTVDVPLVGTVVGITRLD